MRGVLLIIIIMILFSGPTCNNNNNNNNNNCFINVSRYIISARVKKPPTNRGHLAKSCFMPYLLQLLML